MYTDLLSKNKSLAVIGLGYVGLPIALEFARKIKVIGFDIRPDRIEKMRQHIDPSEELGTEPLMVVISHFLQTWRDLKKANFFIVAVPTPIDKRNLPDLSPLLSATETVGKVLKKGDYVVYESTVYPTCTEEDCVPLLEKLSGLNYMKDFKVGFSPERINPGDKDHTLKSIVKVVSGCDEESLQEIAKTYELVVKAGVYRASSIRVAEAAKIIENTQRDINIAFMNELSLIFNKLEINTYEVLEAAGTKWNFLKFFPGLVGGHCIGVDPYYLSFKAKELGIHAQIINAGRSINDSMAKHVAVETVKKIINTGKTINTSRVLIMGATFKENVSDIRNSKVADIYQELVSFGVSVDVTDPFADSDLMKHEYGFGLSEVTGKYDAIILAVNHRQYLGMDDSYFNSISKINGLFIDVKGIFRNKIKSLAYWSL